jgi:hypothetical protein
MHCSVRRDIRLRLAFALDKRRFLIGPLSFDLLDSMKPGNPFVESYTSSAHLNVTQEPTSEHGMPGDPNLYLGEG